MSFASRRILLTGASRGIGLGAARLLLSEGARIIGTGKDAARLEAAAKELQQIGDFHAVAADLTRPAEAADILAAAVQERWGALDILVNNAALGGTSGGFTNGPAADLGRLLEVNLMAPHHLIRALVPLLEKGSEPRVLNVSSGAGQLRTLLYKNGNPNYCLSKYALNGLTILWSRELKGRIAVNALNPGWIRTDMGGPEAPEEPSAGGRRILQALSKPWDETGKFWYGEEEMEW